MTRCRRSRRSTAPAAVVIVVLATSLAACGGDRSRIGAPTTSTRRVPVSAAAAVPMTAPDDGSLGDPNTVRACSLLDAGEIEVQFGRPVGAATPIYPYCQWIVGDGSGFVALTILPMTMDEARSIYAVRDEVDGVGDGAYIDSARALVFGVGDTSYSILWQEVGDFTTVKTDQLRALAEHVLARV